MTLERDDVAIAVTEHLDEVNAGHSLRTAETAGMIALVYGADVDEAWLAGALHDWDRELDEDELLRRAGAHGLVVCDVERQQPRLLHAKTGAATVSETFPDLPTRCCDAIARHTLADVTMSELDMIVYVADMVEPGRRWPGVDDLREAVGTVGLQELFGLAYEQTMLHLIRSRKHIHPVALDVWNSFVARGC